jgi:hypothetical protein
MVPGEVLNSIHKSPNAVHYSKEEGGQYMIGVEVFHQMHCLVSPDALECSGAGLTSVCV